MTHISVSEARKCLGELVRGAEGGRSVSITRRGREVARIVPVEESRSRSLPDLSDFRASIKMKGRPLSKTVIELRAKDRY